MASVEYVSPSELEERLNGIEAGVDGESAYEVAVRNGYQGSELQWLDSLQGEDGIDGEDGLDGSAYNDFELRTRIENLESRPTGSGAPYGWEARLSSFAGNTDDDKLSAAITYVKAQTYKPVIVLDQMKTYTFSRNQGTVFNGLAISGPQRHQDQARSSLPIGNRVNIRTSGFWFNMPSSGSVFGVSLENLSLDGAKGSGLISGGGGVLWTSRFHNISAQNFGNLFGSPSSKLLNTACAFTGWWNINNVQQRAWFVGGSDTNWAFTECLLDSPTNLLGPTEFLAEFNSQSKGTISNMYITAEGHSALRWQGGTAGRTLLTGSIIEGRNAGAPSPGALLRIEGSEVFIRDTWLSYAMSNPAATGRNDQGVVHVTGGTVLMDGIHYERASGVSESVPLLYVSGGRVRIRNVFGKGFTGKPVVKQASPGLIDADNSVTVV